MRYVYSVVRFVPDPARGEAVNLAIVVGSDESSEWELRRVDSLKRARALDDRGILPGVVATIERLARDIDEYVVAIDDDRTPASQLSEGWLQSMALHCRNAVQFSEPVPLLAETLEIAIDMAADEFLLPPAAVASLAESPSLRKHAALAAARRAFRSQGLYKGEHYAERVEVVAGAHGREAFDFVVYDGRALQLVQAWSFRTASQEDLSRRVRAWAWALEGLRKGGGSARADSRELVVAPDIAVSTLYVPPVATDPHPAWDEADTAFRELDVTAIPIDDASRLAIDAARLVGRSQP
jgi:hypothetical protein